MNEFNLKLDVNKFRSTNSQWNELMLNDPWSVGYVTTLIELKPFQNKEAWEHFYYESGKQRDSLISKLTDTEQRLLQDELLIKKDRGAVAALPWDLKNLNTQFGRTKADFDKKGTILLDEVKNNGLGITLEECIECVRFRVIAETWNGVIIREKNTVLNLKKTFPEVEFRKVIGEIDYKYAIDYELYKNGNLTSAIQIKPVSYTWSAPYIERARVANKKKNTNYFNDYGVCVYNIISDSKGDIKNVEILKNL